MDMNHPRETVDGSTGVEVGGGCMKALTSCPLNVQM
jgi:hypothetical protein